MSDPDISILMCTFNRAAYLRDVLRLLVAQERTEEFTYEIVVIDNGSSDETRSVVNTMMDQTKIPIRYVFSPDGGVHQARNRSLQEGRGHWFAFIDDDELPEPDWLARLHLAAQQTGANILGGSVRLQMTDEELASLSREVRRSLRERFEKTEGGRPMPCGRHTFPGTDNLFIDRQVIDKVGGFDETMIMGGADHDLILRAREAGFDPWYVPDAVVHHRIPGERVLIAHLYRDAFGSGVVLAFLRQRYHGSISVILEAIVRLGHALIVTLPLMGWEFLCRDEMGLLDRRMKWWKMIGYLRFASILVLPWASSYESLFEGLDFRKRRFESLAGSRTRSESGKSS